jgi:hypothetical protein
MFWTGLNPYTMEPVYVPRSPQEKAEQRALLQYYLPENHARIRQALIKAGRRDLIGSGPGCLVPADPHAQRTPAARDKKSGDRKQGDKKPGKHPIRNTRQAKNSKNKRKP